MMPTPNGKGGFQTRPYGRTPNGVPAQRRGLLAKVHLAKKDLGLSDLDYRYLLVKEFRVKSAGAMSVPELERLVRHFRDRGWRPRSSRRAGGSPARGPMAHPTKPSQIEALRERAKGIALGGHGGPPLRNGEARLRGLCRSVCRVDSVDWCNEVGLLKRLVAALEKIRREGR